MFPKMLLMCFLAFSALHGTHAVTYEAVNNAGDTPGGARYNADIGLDYSKQTLSAAADFIWRLFQQPAAADRKPAQTLTLIVESFDGVAFAVNNEIHVSAGYVGGYSGDVKTEITGVLYHESAHIWQWNGNGNAPGRLVEGIADFVRLRAGYAPAHWVRAGAGERWDQGYDVTARFLDYCNGLKNGFVAELNMKMRSGYGDEFFVELLGKDVNQLWSEYKAAYA